MSQTTETVILCGARQKKKKAAIIAAALVASPQHQDSFHIYSMGSRDNRKLLQTIEQELSLLKKKL